MFGKNIVMSKIEKMTFEVFIFFINITPLHRSTHRNVGAFAMQKEMR